jgi:hypothetical protein
MVFSRSTLIAVAMTSAVVSATSSMATGRSLLEGENSTTTHAEPRSLLEQDSNILSLCGVDLVGGDIWQAQHKEPDLCVTNCLASTGCDAATWTNFNGGTCFFKRLQGSYANSVPNVGAISFLHVDGSSSGEPKFPMMDMDMPGNDARVVPSPKIEDCYRAFRLSYYTGLTWTNYNGGTCWLKNKASPFVYSPGAISVYQAKRFNPSLCFALANAHD